MTILIASLLTVVVGLWWLTKHRQQQTDEDLYIKPRPVRTTVAIICGNCAGEGIVPYKTMMNINGYCETCGSRSYMLASLRGFLNCRIPGIRLRAITTPPRVLSFDKRRTA